MRHYYANQSLMIYSFGNGMCRAKWRASHWYTGIKNYWYLYRHPAFPLQFIHSRSMFTNLELSYFIKSVLLNHREQRDCLVPRDMLFQ